MAIKLHEPAAPAPSLPLLYHCELRAVAVMASGAAPPLRRCADLGTHQAAGHGALAQALDFGLEAALALRLREGLAGEHAPRAAA